MKRFLRLVAFLLFFHTLHAQKFYEKTPAAQRWVKKKFRKLSKDERIAQLMIIRAHSNLGPEHIAEVTALIKKYDVGGLCFFQGGPVRQATLTNYYQSISKTPLMICTDGEWGLGMRLDSVTSYPHQMMMGATQDAKLIYAFGKAVGEQCKRIGIQVNYAPDIDINNNPLNPVINDRSFGEDKYKVALYGTEYMKGMQDLGVMACAKHFPGHGDVSVDSHKDLPVINKSRAQLDELELYPFRELIKAGVGSMMIAHLYIPAIDTTANLATSLSPRNVTGLLKTELDYKGITFTDALEMQGVTKFFPQGEASVQSLIAGNDMLCLPGDIPGSIAKVKEAIKAGKLTWNDINARVKKVLLAKYHLGLPHWKPVDTANIVNDLNAKTQSLKTLLAQQALTLLRRSDKNILPIKGKKIAYIGIGINKPNALAIRLQKDMAADIFLIDGNDSRKAADLLQKIKGYDIVITGLHNFNRKPANNYGLSDSTIAFVNALQQENNITLVFGNPYVIKYIGHPKNLVACYEDDDVVQEAAADLLEGKIQPRGTLPVTVSEELKFGDGITYNSLSPSAATEPVGLNPGRIDKIDQGASDIIKGAALARKTKPISRQYPGSHL